MALIYLICSCGKNLRAPEEAERKGCICPGCGSRLGGRDGAPLKKSAPKKHYKPEPAPPSILVPQWDEGKRDTRDTPHYTVAPDEADSLPKDSPPPEKKPKKKGLPTNLEEIWEQYILLPFRGGRALFFLSLLLTCALGAVLYQLASSGNLLEDGPQALAGGALLLVVVLVQCGCWYGMLSAVLAGEHDLLSWGGRDFGRVMIGVAYGLACFLAGPAVLLLIAYLFWMNSGDFTWVDWAILGELVGVAAAYWVFCLLAVAIDQNVLSANPFRVAGLALWLGVPSAIIAACVAMVAAVGHAYLIWLNLLEVHEDTSCWFWLLVLFMSAQVWTTYLLLWLGLRSAAIITEEKKRKALLPIEPDEELQGAPTD
jgi:hypothetical protein